MPEATRFLHTGVAGLYKHYKHDPNGEPGNYVYQVLNIAYTKDPDQSFVIYRPLYKSFVYEQGRRWDAKPVEEWFMPAEKNGEPCERYTLVKTGPEYDQFWSLLRELYDVASRNYPDYVVNL